MVFRHLLAAPDAGSIEVLTVIDSSSATDIGKMMLIHPDGRVEGQVAATVATEFLTTIKTLSWSKPITVTLEADGERYRVFWDRTASSFKAVVFGGGHISRPLVQILSMLDFGVTVVDDRPEFANQARFPHAKQIICNSFQQAFAQVEIDAATAVIIVTRGHKYDLECLRATMDSQAGYLGMIGSRKRVKEVFALMEEEGGPKELKQRLRAPIGLDIKAQTPAEIAVSIAAEVVAVFRGGGVGQPLSCKEGC